MSRCGRGGRDETRPGAREAAIDSRWSNSDSPAGPLGPPTTRSRTPSSRAIAFTATSMPLSGWMRPTKATSGPASSPGGLLDPPQGMERDGEGHRQHLLEEHARPTREPVVAVHQVGGGVVADDPFGHALSE